MGCREYARRELVKGAFVCTPYCSEECKEGHRRQGYPLDPAEYDAAPCCALDSCSRKVLHYDAVGFPYDHCGRACAGLAREATARRYAALAAEDAAVVPVATLAAAAEAPSATRSTAASPPSPTATAPSTAPPTTAYSGSPTGQEAPPKRRQIESRDRSFVTLRRDLDSTIGLLHAIRNAQLVASAQVDRVLEKEGDVFQVVCDTDTRTGRIEGRIAELDDRAGRIELALNELIRTLSQSP